VPALRAIARLGSRIAPHLLVSEIRTIAADQLWMSPCYEQDTVAIHFTWRPDWAAVRELLPIIEEALSPFGVRPHWGKLFTMPAPVLQSRLSRLDDFRHLLREYDPTGKFRNAFIDEHIGDD
jgi:xylitol oxidase